MASGSSLVSVVVAASKRTAHVRAAIDSVLAQTHRPLELIVVGGGSGTVAALAARRRALRSARGAYVAFLDGDDRLLPEKIAQQAALLDAHANLGAVHCGHHDVDASGRVIDTAGRQPVGDLRAELLRSSLAWSGGPLVRREPLLCIGDGESLDWFTDWGVWLRVALAGHDFGCVQRPLGCRRVRLESEAEEAVARDERVIERLLEQACRRWALPAEVMAQQEQIRARWQFRLGWRYSAAGAADAAGRRFARAVSLRPAWRDDPEALLDLVHAEATSSSPRPADPVRAVERVLAQLPPELDAVRAARAGLLGRIHLTLALQAHVAGERLIARARLASAVAAEPRLRSAPERFAAQLVRHARRVAPDDPRRFVRRVLDDLPPGARDLAAARPLALAEIAVAETIRRHRLPGAPRRMACAASAAAQRPEVMLRAPRRTSGGVVDALRSPNPRRRVAEPHDPRAAG